MSDSIDFTVFEVSTGKIKRWGNGIPHTEEGEDWIEGKYPKGQYTIVNGLPVPASSSEIDLTRLKTDAKSYVVNLLDGLSLNVSGLIPEVERATWDAKEAAVKAISAGNASPHQVKMLEIEAALVGETPETTKAKILNNMTMFYIAGPVISGLRRKAFLGIDAAQSVEDIEEVKLSVGYIFSSIMTNPLTFNNDPVTFLNNLEGGKQ